MYIMFLLVSLFPIGTSSQCKLSCVSCVMPRSNFLVPVRITRAAAFITRCSLLMMTFSAPRKNDITVVHTWRYKGLDDWQVSPQTPRWASAEYVEVNEDMEASRTDVGDMLFGAEVGPDDNSKAPFFIPSTSFCSLSSLFTSSCAYHLITVTTFTRITYHCLYIPLQT